MLKTTSFKKMNYGTNFNLVHQLDDKGVVVQNQFGSVCCAFTRNASYNLRIFIPCEITDSIGTTEEDINLYIKGINSIGLKTKVSSIIKKDKLSSFKDVSKSFRFNGGNDGNSNSSASSFLRVGSSYSVTSDTKVYCIDIEKNGCNATEMYISFMFLRYLYNHQYFEISKRIINFLKEVPDGDANLIFMASHMFKCFDFTYLPNGYYCLVDLATLPQGSFLNFNTSIANSAKGYNSGSVNSSMTKALPENFPINVIGMYKDFLKKGLYAQAYHLLKKNSK